MLIETFIRKQLRLKAHTVTRVEETDECMLVRHLLFLRAAMTCPPTCFC